MIKRNGGVTLVVLTITVVIILIITGMIVYSAQDSIYVKNLTDMQNDIVNLRDKVSLYYSKYGEIPASTEYPDISNLQETGVIGANDTGKFLIIELEYLDGLSLNFGKDYEKYKSKEYTNLTDLTDLYIINKNSHNIFYVEGIKVKENNGTQIYYTDYTEGDTEAVKIIEIEEVPIPDGFYYVGGTKSSGIVISDDKTDENKYENQEVVGAELQGNQYVWIPVDGILGENSKTIQNAIDGEIILGRYVFDSNGDIDTDLTPTTLKGELKEHSEDTYIYTETSDGYGNTVANNIDGFINSVRENGGYYIARFEASEGENGKAESKYDKSIWAIPQTQAAKACQDLYKGVNSDLINSYVWDTTTLFVQKYSEDKDYSRQAGIQNTLANAGKATDGTNYDVRCNIFDMAGNRSEWTTESSTLTNGPSAVRGGNYYNPDAYNTNRYSHRLDYTIYSFRSILYL